MEITEKIKEITNYAIDKLEDLKGRNIYGCDLHNELFNSDYYIIGRDEAVKWLGDIVFEAIGEIKDYEKDNFGEVTTDLSDPERVVNMYAYIRGEDILQESKTLQDNWDNYLTDENLSAIADELKALIS